MKASEIEEDRGSRRGLRFLYLVLGLALVGLLLVIGLDVWLMLRPLEAPGLYP